MFEKQIKMSEKQLKNQLKKRLELLATSYKTGKFIPGEIIDATISQGQDRKDEADVDIINKRNAGGNWMELNFEMPKLNLSIQESSKKDNLHIQKPEELMSIEMIGLKLCFIDNAMKPKDAKQDICITIQSFNVIDHCVQSRINAINNGHAILPMFDKYVVKTVYDTED